MRQLGCAIGVAAMTAVWQVLFDKGLAPMPGRVADTSAARELLEAGRFAAYAGAFRLLAATAVLLIPGLLLFRLTPPDRDLGGPARRSGRRLPSGNWHR
jgi:hypothetical protein